MVRVVDFQGKVAVVSPRPEDVYADKAGWLVHGFAEAGHSVRRCFTLKELAAADAECDLVLLDHKGAGVCRNALAEMAASRKAVWAQCWRDLVDVEPGVTFDKQPSIMGFRKLMQAIDICFVKERDRIADYARLGIRAVYLDTQGCPGDIPECEHLDECEFDVLVVGSTAHVQRCRDSRALVDAGYRVAWCGLSGADYGAAHLGYAHPIRELPALVSRAAVVLSVDWRCDVPGYTSDRTYLLAGMGAAIVARVPAVGEDAGLTALAEIAPQADVASWIYSETEGLLKCVKQALAEPGARVARGRQGRARVMERHTYSHRAREIIASVEAFQAARPA